MGNTQPGGQSEGSSGVPTSLNSNTGEPDGRGSRPTSSSPILSFHPVHGSCINLSDDLIRAIRVQSFCNGICFSNRPIFPGEKISLRCVRASSAWSGCLRVGFIIFDPGSFDAEKLPKYSSPDLADIPGFWIKALPEGQMTTVGDEVNFYFNKVGTVFCGISSEASGHLASDPVGPFICGLEATRPLWAVIDIYGNTVGLTIHSSLGPNRKRRSFANVLTRDRPSPIGQSGPRLSFDSRNSDSPNLGASTLQTRDPMAIVPASPLSTASTPAYIPPITHYRTFSFRSLTFNQEYGGGHVRLTSDRSIAVRNASEFCNAYVFTSRPVPLGSKVGIQIVKVSTEFSGGLTFGLTACDVSELALVGCELPDNADLLLDRPEYWVVNRDVCLNPSVGDELLFSLSAPGIVEMSRNGGPTTTLIFEAIRLLGLVEPVTQSALHTNTVVALPPEHTPSSTVAASVHRRLAQEVASSVTQSQAASSNQQHKQHPTKPTLPAPPVPTLPAPLVPTRVSQSTRPSRLAPPSNPLVPATTNELSLPSRNSSPTNRHVPPRPSRASPTPPTVPPPPPPSFSNQPSVPARSHKLTSSEKSVATSSDPPSESVIEAYRQNARNALGDTHEAAVPSNTSLSNLNANPSSPGSSDGALAQSECSLCLDSAIDCVLYSCGHLCLCYNCAQSVRAKDNLCPICRQTIKDVIRVYRS